MAARRLAGFQLGSTSDHAVSTSSAIDRFRFKALTIRKRNDFQCIDETFGMLVCAVSYITYQQEQKLARKWGKKYTGCPLDKRFARTLIMLLSDGTKLLDLGDPKTLSAMANELNVSEAELLIAAAAVGRMPKALAYYFKSKSRPLKSVVSEAVRERFALIKQGRRRKRVVAADAS